MKTENENKLTLTVSETAKVLGISKATAYSLVHQKKLPAIRISARRLVVPKIQLQRFLEGQQAATGTRYVFPRINQ
ncbi:MAG: helix-turn-helix domain-containing protein [Dehalococcoidia bacterium]